MQDNALRSIAMFNSLKICNYKALNDFEISKFGRLNLIVGKNNSGKSTVLESIRILAAQGNPSLINDIVINDDDQLLVQQEKDDNDTVKIYEGLFYDRAFPVDDSPIFIGTLDKKIFVEIKRVFFEDMTVETKDNKGSVSISRTRKLYNSREIENNNNVDHTIQVISNQ
jgi:AAA15 family ATPase/GTPase